MTRFCCKIEISEKKNPALFAFIKRKLIGLDFDIFCYFYKCGKSLFKHEQTHQDLLHIFYQMLLVRIKNYNY